MQSKYDNQERRLLELEAKLFGTTSQESAPQPLESHFPKHAPESHFPQQLPEPYFPQPLSQPYFPQPPDMYIPQPPEIQIHATALVLQFQKIFDASWLT